MLWPLERNYFDPHRHVYVVRQEYYTDGKVHRCEKFVRVLRMVEGRPEVDEAELRIAEHEVREQLRQHAREHGYI